MQDIVAGAVSEYDALSAQVINHINIMQKMIELNITDNNDAALNEMFLAAQSKSEKAKFVESEEKDALLAITKVMDNISTWRNDQETSDSPELVLAEESVDAAIFHIDQAKARVTSVQCETLVINECRDFVEEEKEQFDKERAIKWMQTRLPGAVPQPLFYFNCFRIY
jgi:hypothetical protein